MDDLATARERKPKDSQALGLTDSERKDVGLESMIQDISRIRRSAYDRYMKPLGVTRTQWGVLTQLSWQDGMVQANLANLMGIGKASVGSLIVNLEAVGLLVRHPDPIDQRAKRVYLTRSARDLIRRMKKHEIEFTERTLIEISGEKRKALFNELIKIEEYIG